MTWDFLNRLSHTSPFAAALIPYVRLLPGGDGRVSVEITLTCPDQGGDLGGGLAERLSIHDRVRQRLVAVVRQAGEPHRDRLRKVREIMATLERTRDLAEATVDELEARRRRLQLELPPDVGEQLVRLDEHLTEQRRCATEAARQLVALRPELNEPREALRTIASTAARSAAESVQEEIQFERRSAAAELLRLAGPTVEKLLRLEHALQAVLQLGQHPASLAAGADLESDPAPSAPPADGTDDPIAMEMAADQLAAVIA